MVRPCRPHGVIVDGKCIDIGVLIEYRVELSFLYECKLEWVDSDCRLQCIYCSFRGFAATRGRYSSACHRLSPVLLRYRHCTVANYCAAKLVSYITCVEEKGPWCHSVDFVTQCLLDETCRWCSHTVALICIRNCFSSIQAEHNLRALRQRSREAWLNQIELDRGRYFCSCRRRLCQHDTKVTCGVQDVICFVLKG